ncbi:MAG TPA: TIGR03086 family metal-binding protein [Frankiaceae bacterium]|nr:TIGR03086 family metal-binding protein [Frankiaceae bacterium]
MSEQVDLLDAVLGKTGALIAHLPPDAGSRPTPCADYDVAGLVDHLDEWIGTFATSATGSPPSEVLDSAPLESASLESGPPEQDAPWPAPQAERFRSDADRAVAAFRAGAEDRSLTLTSGPVPGSMVLGMMLMEYVGHGWDLAVATGQPVPFDDAEAEAALTVGRQMLSPQYRGPDKPFGHQVPVPDDAPAVDRLIGFLGRDPQARPQARP